MTNSNQTREQTTISDGELSAVMLAVAQENARRNKQHHIPGVNPDDPWLSLGEYMVSLLRERGYRIEAAWGRGREHSPV